MGFLIYFQNQRGLARYHLGHLSNNEKSRSRYYGAFMMIRKSVLDQIGLLDEFFMYGED